MGCILKGGGGLYSRLAVGAVVLAAGAGERIGLAALMGKLDAVMVVLADQPLINAQDIVALIGAWKKRHEGAGVVYPEVDGERGNPVIFSTEVKDEILAGSVNVGCRQWQAKHPERVEAFVTDNRRYRVDIDTPEDLERFERETGHALCWPARQAV